MDKRSYIEPGDNILTHRYIRRPGDQLTPDQIKSLTPRAVIDRVKALKPFFAARARENELLTRPSDEVWYALLSTGYMHMGIHKRFGGLQASHREILEATDAICEADASLGWVAMFCVNTPRQLGSYPPHVQEMIYKGGVAPTTTNLITPAGTAKKVPGGYLVSGRWAWCTTIQLSDWSNMFVQIEDENGNRGPLSSFLAPSSALTVVETWESHGMIGTGTHHVVAEDVFVPEDMTPGENMANWGSNSKEMFPDYPFMHAATLPWGANCIAAICVASANGAVEAARERLLSYNKRGSTVPEKEKMSQQMRLSRASVLATAAKLLVYRAADVCCETLTDKDAPTKDAYFETQAWSAEACELAREVVTMLMQSNGTSVHYLASAIGRHFRDVHTGSSHAMTDYDPVIQKWGQQMLGVKQTAGLTLEQQHKVRDEVAASRSGNYARTSTEQTAVKGI